MIVILPLRASMVEPSGTGLVGSIGMNLPLGALINTRPVGWTLTDSWKTGVGAGVAVGEGVGVGVALTVG